MTDIVVILLFATNSLSALLAYMLGSRCTRIKCCDCELERMLERTPHVSPPEGDNV